MAFDGFTVHSIVYELNRTVLNGRLSKIMQPEKDELCLVIKAPKQEDGNYATYYLTLSANPTFPLVSADRTGGDKTNPATAPNFCMLLRKYIANGKIISITQKGLERVIDIEIEHMNEMADLKRKHLMVELMGKHSNIIFCGDAAEEAEFDFMLPQDTGADTLTIIDSIKHVPSSVSSVREVLPGRPYFIPKTEGKCDPFEISETDLTGLMNREENNNLNVTKFLYTKLTGFSPFASEELVYACGIDSSAYIGQLDPDEKYHLAHQVILMIEKIRKNEYEYNMVLDSQSDPVDYAVFPITHMTECSLKSFDAVFGMLTSFYSEKELASRIRQKSTDLRKIIQNSLERSVKKLDLMEKQMKDTEKRDRYKMYGDLLSTYGYSLENGLKECTLENYYDENKPVRISLDETMTALENGRKYYEKYAKLKRTYEALLIQIEETQNEVNYLSSVKTLLEQTRDANNLTEIKEELIQSGYIRKAPAVKGKKNAKSPRAGKPYHYISSDGFDIYVGKNNLQNDALSFDFADGNDLWFHAKKMPGSHVIVKVGKNRKEDLPDRLFEEAGALAAYYSSGRDNPKVEIDYIEKKFLKKPPKANPGFVIYHSNYSLVAIPELKDLKEVNE